MFENHFVPSLSIRFGFRLLDPPAYKGARPQGLIFHRWLPNGIRDAINLNTGDSKIELKVWLERYGETGDKFIKYDEGKRNVDISVMKRQGTLDAGPLFGEFLINQINHDEFRSIVENKTGDQHYVNFGKRLIKKWFDPQISKLVNVFRLNLGQYWLKDYLSWDSRVENLGSYCKNRGMYWYNETNNKWYPFLPQEPELEPVTLILGGYHKYEENITEADWQDIPKILEESDHSLGLVSLQKTNEYFGNGHITESFIQGYTTIELAIEDFLRHRTKDDKVLSERINSFIQIDSLPLKYTTIAVSIGIISKKDVANTLEAIRIRNEIIHEGKSPKASDKTYLFSLMDSTKAILSYQKIKIPQILSSNAGMSDEQWEKHYKSRKM